MGRRRANRAAAAPSARLDAWMPELRVDALNRFDRALHDMEYEYMRRELKRRFYAVEEVAERAGVDPRVVVTAVKDDVTREEYGLVTRKCRRSRYGLCVQHTMDALLRGPHGPAWQAWRFASSMRAHLRSCQAGSFCLIRSREELDILLRDLVAAQMAIDVEDIEKYEEWLGIDAEKLRAMLDHLVKSGRKWYES